MGRPIYPCELGDPDFSWLINNFQENNPNYKHVEAGSLPVVFIRSEEAKFIREICVPKADALEESAKAK